MLPLLTVLIAIGGLAILALGAVLLYLIPVFWPEDDGE